MLALKIFLGWAALAALIIRWFATLPRDNSPEHPPSADTYGDWPAMPVVRAPNADVAPFHASLFAPHGE